MKASRVRCPVTFTRVGRGKLSWSEELDYNLAAAQPDVEALERSVRKHRAIVSADLDFDFEELSGTVIVGGFRVVGSFSWTEPRV